MKTNKIITILFSLLIIASFSSCDLIIKEKIEPVSEMTTYPIFVFTGGQTMVHTIGTTWTDPGVLVSEVKEGDNDLAGTLVIDDTDMDINTRGLYSIRYTATNSYGFKMTVSRYVLVTSGVNDLYPIDNTYVFGYSGKEMTISENEVKGFWNVENIRNPSKYVSGVIADFGDQTYQVALSLFKRKISNLRYIYLTGTAEYDNTTTPETITFTLQEVYDDGTPLTGDKTYKWDLKEN